MITSYQVFVPLLMGGGSSLRVGMETKKLGCKKAFFVFDDGMRQLGFADRIIENLEAAGVEAVCFGEVVPDPPDEMIEAAAAIARAEQVDCIIALGGGSSMDTAKGINVLINNPPPIRQYFGVQHNLKPGVPLIFIPTTSGTGSEVTNMCVITCVSKGNKDSVVSPVCLGTLAVLDHELTMGLPPGMTAATGIDAFAHAVESLTGGQANPMADALAELAIRKINKWLPIAVKDGSNETAREQMLLASSYAGMAFTNSLVHLGHSIGHTIGAQFHVPHGIACALALPEVIEYTAKTESHKVSIICDAMDIDLPADATAEQIGTAAKDAIRSLCREIKLPTMQDLNIPAEAIPKLAALVLNDTGFAILPYRINAARVAELITAAYNAGKES